MSQIDSILGLSDLTIQRVDRGQIIQVWASPKTRPRCIHCLNHPVRIKATHLSPLFARFIAVSGFSFSSAEEA